MLRIKIVNRQQRKQVTHLQGELWLGRAPGHEPASILIDDPFVSRIQLRVEEKSQGEVDVQNLGRAMTRLGNNETIPRGETARLKLPMQLSVGRTTVAIASVTPATSVQPEEPQVGDTLDDAERTKSLAELGESPSPATLARWFETLLAVHLSAAGSDAFYDETASAVVELVGLDRGLVLLRDHGVWLPKARCTVRDEDEFNFSSSVLKEVLVQRRTVYDLPTANLLTASLRGIEAVVASPIFDRNNEVVGVVYGSRDVFHQGGAIRPLESQFVQLLASTVGTGLQRLEQQRQLLQYENELAIGRRIQTSFLPNTLPHREGWEIAAHFSPAREVSGDFYDVFLLPHGPELAIAIADVCDKGVGAALFMALVRTLVRAFATGQAGTGSVSATVHERNVVELVHQYVLANHHETSMFATLFFGVLDTITGELVYVNGGHEPPVVWGARGLRQRLEPTGPAVGSFSDAQFSTGRVILEAGDLLFAYTDGVTEARDVAGEFYGRERLSDLLRQGTPSASDLLDRVEQSIREHLSVADQSDDIAMLALRRLQID